MRVAPFLSGAAVLLAAGASLSACSGSKTFLPVQAIGAAASDAGASVATVAASIRIVVPRDGKRAPGARYVSPATRSISIEMKRSGTRALHFDAGLTPKTNRGCKNAAGRVTCVVQMALVPGLYSATLTTYDGLLTGGKPAGKRLSVDRNLPVTIRSKGKNAIHVSLDGVPASVAFGVPDGSVLTGGGNALTMPKCASSAQLAAYAVDAGGYPILGAGAPSVSLVSNGTALAVSKSGSASNTFTLTRSTAIPNGGSAVGLTAKATPAAGSGAKARSANAVVTFDRSICGVFTEWSNPASGGYPYQITAGADDAMWFTDCFSGKIGRITTTGTISEYAPPLKPSNTHGIARGPDGNVWFADSGSNAIGKVTTAGVITEYPIATANAQPYGIAAGPDGALWFAECGVNKIARVTTSGAFTEYPIPTAGSRPTFITAGPDGALWFGEYSGDKVGRIPTGAQIGSGAQITEFKVSGTYVGGLATGPDGAIWFGSGAIDRLETGAAPGSSAIPFALPDGATADQVALGGDGAIWFVDYFGNKIARITTAGVVTEYPIPTALAGPQGIALGPDGAIWFAECTSNKIGRLQ